MKNHSQLYKYNYSFPVDYQFPFISENQKMKIEKSESGFSFFIRSNYKWILVARSCVDYEKIYKNRDHDLGPWNPTSVLKKYEIKILKHGPWIQDFEIWIDKICTDIDDSHEKYRQEQDMQRKQYDFEINELRANW